MQQRPIPPLGEKGIQQRVRASLRRAGFTLSAKTHGTRFQAGWPDLFCFHPDRGGYWVEIKTPRGKLTRAQRRLFAQWEAAGVPIWVLCGPEDVALLNGPCNVGEWL